MRISNVAEVKILEDKVTITSDFERPDGSIVKVEAETYTEAKEKFLKEVCKFGMSKDGLEFSVRPK